MDALEKEINELKQFMVDLKADRAATKAKEKAEAWTKYVALTLVIIAVIAAVANQYSGKYGSQVQINQIKASDQWNFYESKSIKQHLDEAALPELLASPNAANPAVQKAIKQITSDLARFDTEKADIKAQAEAFEKKRDEAGVRGRHMGLSVTLFSVAIATASICTVTKRKPLWFAAMAMAAFAIFKMLLAWTV
jgi:flagellin-like hook-associated protein FlgL